jgi:integrase
VIPVLNSIIRTITAKAGRWLAAERPEITEPGQWTRQTCAAWVAAVDRMTVGDYVQRTDALGGGTGKPVSPRTKAHQLMATRMFFRDCQEWEWIPRRFDPVRALAVPRSVSDLISTDPRVIADDVWAKLLHAGLNIEAGDLPGTSAGTYYPVELIRALTLTWLFSGLRSDEIVRLRTGCIRWQRNGTPVRADSREVIAAEAVCLLDVPVHKSGTAFTKPVDPIVGQAIEAWQALRPAQPPRTDRKTGEQANLLFSVRAHPVARAYINRTMIPALCAKAGVPTADVRGNITSHRARSTIASQLYNAKEPMTLFELQAWLGHRTPNTTQHSPCCRAGSGCCAGRRSRCRAGRRRPSGRCARSSRRSSRRTPRRPRKRALVTSVTPPARRSRGYPSHRPPDRRPASSTRQAAAGHRASVRAEVLDFPERTRGSAPRPGPVRADTLHLPGRWHSSDLLRLRPGGGSGWNCDSSVISWR